MLKLALELNFVTVPFKGGGPMTQSLLGGHTPIVNSALGNYVNLIKAGKLRPLAVLDGERSKLLPEVPTIAEAGYADLAVGTWFGLFVPAHVPKEIVQRINAEVMKVLASPEVLAKYETIGVDPVKPHSPEAFGSQLKAEISKWGKVVKEANIKVD